MSNIPNAAKQVVADTEAVVTDKPRHLVARLMRWLRTHPHAMLVIAAAAVILAVTLGMIRG